VSVKSKGQLKEKGKINNNERRLGVAPASLTAECFPVKFIVSYS
jgi:hypothetical protein